MTRDPPARARVWPGVAVWGAAAVAMVLLDGRVDVTQLSLIPVLAAALAALWLRQGQAVAACALAALAFNVGFVPPRGSLTVGLNQHVLMLATMLVVSTVITLLVARQRRLAVAEWHHAMRAEQLQALGQALRDADDPREQAPRLQQALSAITGEPVALMLLPRAPGAGDSLELGEVSGTVDADARTGLWLSLRSGRAMGPGTGRHEEQPAWYLPMRGRQASFGAAHLPLPTMPDDAATALSHAQALCDQMGLALERSAALTAAAAARDDAQAERVRTTLLAAIAHDFRTPLATVIGAASSLHDQGDRLSPAQRRTLATTIIDEAGHLARMADNTLQLARLGSPGRALPTDWESVEELVGTVLRRARQRHDGARLQARLEPGLPLLRCDAVSIVQMLDNLVDNALEHAGATAPVEILARRQGDRILLAVRDRGPGIRPADRERIFEAFQRGDGSRGAGLGLALGRAVAQAHGAELRVRARARGGSSFECSLPCDPTAPQALPADPAWRVASP